jgi:hypothetical protein
VLFFPIECDTFDVHGGVSQSIWEHGYIESSAEDEMHLTVKYTLGSLSDNMRDARHAENVVLRLDRFNTVHVLLAPIDSLLLREPVLTEENKAITCDI